MLLVIVMRCGCGSEVCGEILLGTVFLGFKLLSKMGIALFTSNELVVLSVLSDSIS